MSSLNYFFRALLLSGFVLGTYVFASEPVSYLPATASASAPTVNVSLRGGETVNGQQIERAFITVGTNELAFMVPGGFHMDASDPGKIVFSDNTGKFFITVRVSGSVSLDAESQVAFFQDRALKRFPSANVSSKFSTFAAGHAGPGYDLNWINSNGGGQYARIVFIPSPAGVLEFSVLARSADIADAQSFLTVLMASVRSNETGKIVITRVSGNS
jgi:hypothetical protein